MIPHEMTPSQFYDLRKSFAQSHPTMVFFEDLASLGKQVFPLETTLEDESVRLKVAEKIQIFDVFSQLEQTGYRPAEDQRLKPGEFVRRGENLFVYPANEKECVRIDLFGDDIERIDFIDQDDGKVLSELKEIQILPA
ncbi:hypothetical protein HC823_02305, partial [Candidatus Gracilibacteria bacterium]|nr:hypothetical protein [Candidatus Gracilibacteria bacterium]